MTRRTLAARRAGFTLLELLIVIVIIGILASLVLAGVNVARNAGLKTQITSDISQLGAALARFKQDFGVYPPTSYTVPTGGTMMTPVANTDGYLTQMFPRATKLSGNFQSDPTTPLYMSGKTLDCNQCLVFFSSRPQSARVEYGRPISR